MTRPTPVYSQEQIEYLLSHLINYLRHQNAITPNCLYDHRDALRPHLKAIAHDRRNVRAVHDILDIVHKRSTE